MIYIYMLIVSLEIFNKFKFNIIVILFFNLFYLNLYFYFK